MKAHILIDTDDNKLRERRHLRMIAVLSALGYECCLYDKSFCNLVDASNMETQMGLEDGKHISYADRIQTMLRKSSDKDVVIATEAWHSLCFKNLIAGDGRYLEMPVVEFWIDYSGSFARYRVFSSRYVMYHTYGFERVGAAYLGNTEPWPDWIAAKPFYDVGKIREANIRIKTYTMRSPTFALTHLEDASVGIPVAAPDWGVWREYCIPNHTVCLYRSDVGFKSAQEAAVKLPSQTIIDWVQSTFSVQIAAKQIESYMDKLCNG